MTTTLLQVDGDQLDHADQGQAAGPAGHAGRESQHRPEPQLQPAGRDGRDDDQGRDRHRGARGQDELGRGREPGQRETPAQGDEREVGGDEDEAGDDGARDGAANRR